MNCQCSAIKANGERCQGVATRQGDHCPAHDPDRATQRQRAASRAGRARPKTEVRALKDELRTLADGVRDGTTGRADAAVINQILNTRARLVELERKIVEQDEILSRIEDLEEQTSDKRGGGRWRAG